MKIINECRVNYQYRLSPNDPIIIKTLCSNVVSTDIIRNMLKIDKYVDKKYTTAFDILTYTIVIKNISQLYITKIFFQDKIPNRTKFLENSVTVNGLKKRCANPEIGFYIGNLEEGCEAIITFKVVSLPYCINHLIKNYSTIEYDYIFNIDKDPTRITIDSNNAITLYENRTFKQMVVEHEIKICKEIDEILDTNIKINVLDVKIINAPINESYLTKKIKTCTILVICSIEYKILCSHQKKIKNKKVNECSEVLINDIFGFSNYMIVPVGITYIDKNNIKILIENTTSSLIDCETIFISTNMLMYY